MSASRIFQNEETFQKIYLECLESIPQATETIKKSYKEMGRIFDEYIADTEECMFRYAYECGYRAAMAKMEMGR